MNHSNTPRRHVVASIRFQDGAWFVPHFAIDLWPGDRVQTEGGRYEATVDGTGALRPNWRDTPGFRGGE